ncbi:SPOR domain-containing protein [Candidatus Omnitrophota bacterium]
MTEPGLQRDFFNGQYYEKKGRKPSLLRRYSEQRFLPHIKIPVEYVVIIAIGILMLAIVSYAVGVERGKRLSGIGPEEPTKESVITSEEKDVRDMPVPVKEEAKSVQKRERAKTDVEKAPAQKRRTVVRKVESVYLIQLASFRNQDAAVKEAVKLNQKGIATEIAKSGDWYQVYAAGYRTIEEARDAKKKLSVDYKDCFIRRKK